MTQFLKRFFYYPCRFIYRLVCWINYPTSRQRMWSMYSLGKAQGIKEALKDLPIVQVQPRQAVEPVKLNLPPGEWTRQWLDAQRINLHKINHVDASQLASKATSGKRINEDDSWLNSKPIERVPTVKIAPDDTLEVPAINALFHQERQER